MVIVRSHLGQVELKTGQLAVAASLLRMRHLMARGETGTYDRTINFKIRFSMLIALKQGS